MTFLPQSLLDGPVGPNKDLVINGFMDVNQRNVSSLTSSGYIQDRMSVYVFDLPGLFSADELTFPPASGQVPQSPDKYLRISFNGTLGGAGTEHYAGFRYKFAYPQKLVNHQYTVEFYGRVNNPLTIGIEGRLAADSGTPADDVSVIDYKTHLMTTTGLWQRQRFLVNIPTWAPASLGPAPRYELLFWLTMGAARTDPFNVGQQAADLDIVNFGMFPGDLLHVPEDLKGMRDPHLEMYRSQPYYQKGQPLYGTVPSSGVMRTRTQFFTPMVRVPDVTLSGQSSGYNPSISPSKTGFTTFQNSMTVGVNATANWASDGEL